MAYLHELIFNYFKFVNYLHFWDILFSYNNEQNDINTDLASSFEY